MEGLTRIRASLVATALAAICCGGALAGAAAAAPAGKTLRDGFAHGIATSTWKVTKTETSYRVTDGGAVHLSTSGGGAGGFQWVGLQLKRTIGGNFDVSVRYSNASLRLVNGSPANQVQLNAKFGGQLFCVVRDDDVVQGNNVHVFTNTWYGARKSSATSGVLRIVRTGSTVTGYANGVRLYKGTFNASPVTQLWFSLQNNGTTDPISVVFDDFSLTADVIG